MADDVPLGGLTLPGKRDGDARRREDERHVEEGYLLVRTLAWLDGRPAGYTQILLASDAPQMALQDDTLVDRSCRHAGVARALKVVNLEHLQSLPQASATQSVQTYCAETNTAILARKAALGFRCVHVMTALEGLPEAAALRRT